MKLCLNSDRLLFLFIEEESDFSEMLPNVFNFSIGFFNFFVSALLKCLLLITSQFGCKNYAIIFLNC